MAPEVTAIVVSHNSADDLRSGLPLLHHPDVETLLIDNDSSDTTGDVLAEMAKVRYTTLPVNVGWSRGCNIGAGQADGAVLAFVNPDARVSGDQLLAMARRLADPAVGAVAPRFVDPDGSAQAFYFRFPGVLSGLFCFLNAGQRIDRALGYPFLRWRTYDLGRRLPGPVDQPGAACLLVRAEDFQALGGFRDDMFLFFADTDLCLRLRAASKHVEVAWDVDVIHRGGGSVHLLPEDSTRRHLQRDYLRYVHAHHGRGAAAATRVAITLLTGLLPATLRVLRGRPADAWRQLRLAASVLR